MAVSVQENVQLVQRFWDEVWTQGNLTATDDIVSTDFVLYTPQGQKNGAEGLKQWVTSIRSAAPDIQFIVDDTISEGNKVVTSWRGTGTNSGSFLGRPPTNKALAMTGISIFRIENGKIKAEWLTENTWELLQQLGMATLKQNMD